MQTIFRVQSTDTETYPGKMKAECYVFDFAPDRSLKMIAETAKFANLTKKEKNAANTASKDDDIARMEEFMNFFAVVSLEGGKMVPYDAESLFRQLDNVYIDRVVRNGFNDNMFRLIKTCTEANEALEIHKTVHEGTSKVRMSRLQLLTIEFENLRMYEYESISDCNIRLRDIANTSFALGEKMSDEKLARKILRSLPKKFDMKVTTIEEA
jgi:hypothetical protein